MSAHATPKLAAEPRTKTGTRYAARLREEGKLPGVIYGHKQDNLAVTVEAGELNTLLQGHAHLVEVEVEGKVEPCLIKDVQWNHLSSHIIHVDLARVDLAEEVEVDVELVLEGEPEALKESGIMLDHPTTQITIASRADSIPENITCDISGLELGKHLTVADLSLPAGVKAVTDAETIIALLSEAKHVEEEIEGEEGAAEPEVIGKADGEEEEAAAE